MALVLRCRTRSHNRDRCLLVVRCCPGELQSPRAFFDEIGCFVKMIKHPANKAFTSGFIYALYAPLRGTLVLMIVVVPLMLCCLCSGFAFSLVALCLGARMKPVIGKNDLICFLGIGLFVFLWIVLVLPLFSTSVSANNLEDFPRLLLFLFLLGFTPSAAFPSLILCGPGKHAWRRKY